MLFRSKGIGLSSGIAVGNAVVKEDVIIETKQYKVQSIEEECLRLMEATEKGKKQLQDLYELTSPRREGRLLILLSWLEHWKYQLLRVWTKFAPGFRMGIGLSLMGAKGLCISIPIKR